MSHFGDLDRHLFASGTHARLWERLGAHPVEGGVHFGVWAPNAREVQVISAGNDWGRRGIARLSPSDLGVWEGTVASVNAGDAYKYRVTAANGEVLEKADPLAFFTEPSPGTASRVHALDYTWGDSEWMASRGAKQALSAPMSIYEVHLGSWRRGDGNRVLGYRELAAPLADYAVSHGFTHVELMPVMEHPFYGSWGYQVTGFFAPTARYGTPQDFMALVDHLHQRGLGVILDWPPAHFPHDAHGLGSFDGTHLYEHADPRQGHHPEWGSAVFNYGRNEVRSFLISCANFWLTAYHADALRVDAVSSMLYLDYGRKAGEWVPNEQGGNENLAALHFMRTLNETLYREHPDVQLIAEESTAWPMVTRPTSLGGLGYGLKWDLGFMNDTLSYFREDPIHRRFHHHKLTFRAMYAQNENFLLPLSHDEVVHGKGSLLSKMPGDEWQQRANLRLLLAYQWAQPGKKLLFMGGEFGQRREWNHDESLDWHLVSEGSVHARLQRLVGELNRLYREEPALHELDCGGGGFEWAEVDDAENSVVAFVRRGQGDAQVLAVFNCTPVPRANYRLGVSRPGRWVELLNTDAEIFGGSSQGNLGGVDAAPAPRRDKPFSLSVTLPPLAAVFFKPQPAGGA